MKEFLLLRKSGAVRNKLCSRNLLFLAIITLGLALSCISSAFAQSDAGVVAIPRPSANFNVGQQEVWATIKNYSSTTTLASVTVNWKVDNLVQTALNWTGTLAANDTVSVLLGVFDFQNKSPLSSFNITAWTTNPNGGIDANPANDSATISVAPYLSGNTYTVGGSNPDFLTLSGLGSYLGISGFRASGDIVFNLRAGSYDEQAMFSNFTNDSGNIIIQSETGDPSTVNITYTIDNRDSNFIWRFNNARNIVIRNLTFTVFQSDSDRPDNPPQIGGHIFDIRGKSNNITIENNIFYGIQRAPKTEAYAIIYAAGNDSATHNITGNTFNYGSIGIYEQSRLNGNLKLNIGTNGFTGYSWIAVRSIGVDSASITGNTILGGGLADTTSPAIGIYATDGTYIAGNTITGLVGSGTDSTEAAIKVIHTNAANKDSVVIENNTIANCVNINGIYVQAEYALIRNNNVTISDTITSGRGAVTVVSSGTAANPARIEHNVINAVNAWGVYLVNSFAKVYNNMITATRDTTTLADSLGFSSSAIMAVGSSGYIANNFITGRSSTGVMLNGSSNLALYYNTIVAGSMTVPALSITGSGNTIMRNIIMNLDSGIVISGTGIAAGGLVSNQNDIFTTGRSLVIWNGVTYDTLSAFSAVSLTDLASVSLMPPFLSPTDFRLANGMEGIYARTPLPLDSLLNAEIQMFDFDQVQRRLFYFGASAINPSVSIVETSPRSVIDCEGTTGHNLVVTTIATSTTAAIQWFKDDVPIPGATGPILTFDTLRYENSGLYRAMVTGTGGADTLFSDYILVYALSPTMIIDSIRTQSIALGNIVRFEVKIHAAEVFIDSILNTVQIQWFRGDSALQDNDRISGSKSSILSIRDLQPADYGNDYHVVVTSKCGSDTSGVFGINIPPTINITTQPADVVICEGDSALFNVVANISTGDTNLLYQWRYNGVNLARDTTGRLTGFNTSNLMIRNLTVADTGLYSVIVRSGKDTTLADTSATVRLTVNTKPVFAPRTRDSIAVLEGDSLKISRSATGTEPITYQWFRNDSLLTGMTDTTLFITAAARTDSGLYTVKATNQCGTTTSDTILIVVNPKQVEAVADGSSGGFALLPNSPNPFGEMTKISYITPYATHVRLVVTDMYGREIAVLADATVDAGYHSLSFTAADYGLASGVYYYTLIAGGTRETNKMVIVR